MYTHIEMIIFNPFFLKKCAFCKCEFYFLKKTKKDHETESKRAIFRRTVINLCSPLIAVFPLAQRSLFCEI